MNNIIKKVIVSSCVVVSLFSVSAFGVHNKYDYFDFGLGAGTNYVSSVANPKNDSEQTAYVTVQTKTDSSTIVHMRVVNASNNVCTNEKNITSTGKYTMPYRVYSPAGSNMKLQMQATTQYQAVFGVWDS